MKWILVILVFCLVGVAEMVPALPEPGKPCEPWTRWSEGCKTCFCSVDGTPDCEEDLACNTNPELPPPSGPECLAGTTWEDECYKCKCSLKGRAICVQKSCNRAITEAIKHCKPKTSWDNDCNTCFCSPFGFGSCTQMGCLSFEKLPENTASAQRQRSIRSVPALPEPGKACEPWTRWSEGCKTCFCSDDGTPDCKDDLACNTDPELPPPYGPECLAGSTWEEECFKCKCSLKGRAICVQKSCSRSITEAIKHCKPKTSWANDCNNCFCSSIGSAGCTLMGCVAFEVLTENAAPAESQKSIRSVPEIKVEEQPENKTEEKKTEKKKTEEKKTEEKKTDEKKTEEKSSPCEPWSSWSVDCKQCFCDKDGVASCKDDLACNTDPELPPPYGAECLAGSTWEDECYKCHCSAKSRAICVKQACGKTVTGPIRHCAANTSWPNDCNSCFCTETGISGCTLKGCAPPMQLVPVPVPTSTPDKLEPVHGVQCAIGTSWQSQCNQCQCSDTGYAFCTLKRCPDQEHEEEQLCAPDSTWMNDCNSCFCHVGRAVCTKIGCVGIVPPGGFHFDDDSNTTASETETNPLQSIEKRSAQFCYPGDVIQRECNTCRCNADGTDFDVCTKRGCLQGPPIDVAQIQWSNSRIRRAACKPLDIFKEECNTCMCDPQGTSYNCTHNECMEENTGDVEVFMENKGTDHIERHSVCEPRATFQVTCNTCVCNEDGTDFVCTNTVCPLPDDVELFHELKETRPIIPYRKCDPNKFFEMDCKKCQCDKNGLDFSCIKKQNCITNRENPPKFDPEIDDLIADEK